MGGGKLPPRQKMIGMMYLVLTALLAMNVSKDILNAFILVNNGLEKTISTFEYKNEVAYAAFGKALSENETKVKPYYDKAMLAKQWSNELIDHIDKMKIMLIRTTDKKLDETQFPDDSLKLENVDAKDNYDEPTRLLIGGEPASPIEGPNTGSELKAKINELRENLMNLIDEKDREFMDLGLQTPDGEENGVPKPWEVMNFDHTPLAATITLLSKVQVDIRNAEADVVKYLFGKVDAGDFKFDVITAKMIPSSNYVLLGDSFTADIFVAAYSTTVNPEILVGDYNEETRNVANPIEVPVTGGIGKYKLKTSKEGITKWGGVIKLKAPDGQIKDYPFGGEYMVAKPSVVVSPTSMNVLYIGIDNPVDVSAAGFAAEDIEANFSGQGSIRKVSPGKYIVKPTGGNEGKISVVANKQSIGQPFQFRVKSVPDPVAMFGGKKGSSNIGKNDLLNVPGVIPVMENFDFDLKFEILSFDITAIIKGFENTEKSSSNRVTDGMKTLFKNCGPNTKIYIENIKARGPDGRVRDLSPINLKVI
jgi:gliding motility-associated protein GldM